MLVKWSRTGAWQVVIWLALVSAAVSCGQAQTFEVLYNFTGGVDGGGLQGGVAMDKQGNLYGTTTGGGLYGYGTVFELSPNADGTWNETVLYNFANGDPKGQNPQSTLVLDPAGNLYGTAASGGIYNGGTAFELSHGSGTWILAVLYSFGGYVGDATAPKEGMIIDAHGNLYGGGVEEPTALCAGRSLNSVRDPRAGPRSCSTALVRMGR